LRIQKYHQISESLSSLTDQELSDCNSDASSLHAGIGGNMVSQFGGDDWHNKLSIYLGAEGLITSSGAELS
jgi:hypothetical protein